MCLARARVRLRHRPAPACTNRERTSAPPQTTSTTSGGTPSDRPDRRCCPPASSFVRSFDPPTVHSTSPTYLTYLGSHPSSRPSPFPSHPMLVGPDPSGPGNRFLTLVACPERASTLPSTVPFPMFVDHRALPRPSARPPVSSSSVACPSSEYPIPTYLYFLPLFAYVPPISQIYSTAFYLPTSYLVVCLHLPPTYLTYPTCLYPFVQLFACASSSNTSSFPSITPSPPPLSQTKQATQVDPSGRLRCLPFPPRPTTTLSCQSGKTNETPSSVRQCHPRAFAHAIALRQPPTLPAAVPRLPRGTSLSVALSTSAWLRLSIHSVCLFPPRARAASQQAGRCTIGECPPAYRPVGPATGDCIPYML